MPDGDTAKQSIHLGLSSRDRYTICWGVVAVHRPLPIRRRVAARPSALLALVVLLAAPRPAGAVVRICSPDPLANTANVLCAPPSGPCDDSLVVVSTNLTVREGHCEFDLGGRALRMERTFRVPGHEFGGTLDGRIALRNAGDVTITRRAKLKARGDFVEPAGDVIGGGTIIVQSAGAIQIDGLLDVTGDTGGDIAFLARGDIELGARGKVRGHGISSFRDEGARFADGGDLFLRSLAGSVRVLGAIALPGANQAEGGEVDLEAGHDVVLARGMDLSGGGGGGGEFFAGAGDDVHILGSIDASSRSGGEFGGDIFILAGIGDDPASGFVGVKAGGDLEIHGVTLDVRGSANTNTFTGDGGSVDVSAAGAVHVGADVVVHADSAPNLPDAGGGYVAVTSGEDLGDVPAADTDLEFAALVSARGTEVGGALSLFSAGDILLSGPADLSGGFGGVLDVEAARNATISAPIRLDATRAEGFGGDVRLVAGRAAFGTLTIAADILASAGTAGDCIDFEATSCALRVAPRVTLAASCNVFFDILRLTGRDTIDLGAGARFFAGPNGRVATIHPTGVVPTVGAGTLFTSALVDREDANAEYPACGS